MNTSIGFSCNVRSCKRVEYVRVSEMIKAGKELIPKGWVKYDLGIDAPDEYLLCSAHAQAYKEDCETLLRKFVLEEAS